MWKDPIVEEVRKAGETLVKAAGYDKDLFFTRLQKNQQKSRRKIVSFSKKKSTAVR